MADLIDVLTKQIEQYLPDSEHFVVQVAMKPIAGKQKILILLDADNGLDIDTCASVSRQLAAWIEETDLIKEAYILEVSSPGLDFPLQGERMYAKNKGRSLKVVTTEGATHKGQLIDINAEGFKLMPEVKKKPKKGEPPIQPLEFNYSQVKKALVQVSFAGFTDED